MGHAASMNASIKANAELRKRKRVPFYKRKSTIQNCGYILKPLSRSENSRIRASIKSKIVQEEFHRRVVGVIVLIPVLWFLYFLLDLFINWL